MYIGGKFKAKSVAGTTEAFKINISPRSILDFVLAMYARALTTQRLIGRILEVLNVSLENVVFRDRIVQLTTLEEVQVARNLVLP